MPIYLVQHGISLSKDANPDPGLTEEGEKSVARIAGVAASYGIRPTQIRHSGKQRAKETAEIMKKALGVTTRLTQMKGIKPLDDVAPFTQTLDGIDGLMIVGHLPFLERLCALLTTGDPDLTVFKFQNGGIVCLDQLPPPFGWVIKWALMPEIS
jgi:phosphohistidine phosphatase